jgi:hypothetical protein
MDYGSYCSGSYASIPSQPTQTYNSSWGGGEDSQAPFDLGPQVSYTQALRQLGGSSAEAFSIYMGVQLKPKSR